MLHRLTGVQCPARPLALAAMVGLLLTAYAQPALAAGSGSATVKPDGVIEVILTPAPGEELAIVLRPRSVVGPVTAAPAGSGRRVRYGWRGGGCAVRVEGLADGCALTLDAPPAGGLTLDGTVTGGAGPLYAARVALDEQREPTVWGGGDVLDIAVGRAANRRANAVYSTRTFRGALLDAGDGTVDLCPTDEGYTFAFSSGRLALRTLDVWPLIGWRPASAGSTYGHPEAGQPHVIPREWMENHRPFPWETFSPVQLPFISITDPADFDRVKEQVDFLAGNLRDWGFSVFGEWPLTQRNPDYAPPEVWQAYLEGTRRTCDYAHGRGIRILRWVTDPDIQPAWYPELHETLRRNGWFSHEEGSPEWLPDYTNPDVQRWIEDRYAELGETGPDFYWVDNNHPTRPLHDPARFPPAAFREFYLAIQRGLLSTGRQDILVRSGASEWADYAAAGVLDVYAPGPDVQNDWTEQQIYVARELAFRDYLCHFNLWRRCIDDFFPAGPQTLDQTRAMATLLGLTGLGFTTTDIGFPNLPAERLQLLRQLVPIAETRPLDLYRFSSGALPRWWVLNQQDEERLWQIAGVFNWGLEAEETHFMPLADLGLDPAQEYLVYDFWSQRPVGRFRGGIGLRVAPASGPALAIHPVGERPFIVATDRHVTMGASELAARRWDAPSRTLSAEFVAGVAGHVFSLTLFSPPRLAPVRAVVSGRVQPIEDLGDGLYRVPIPTDGPNAALAIAFERVRPPAAGRPPRLPKGLIDLSQRSVLKRVATPEGIEALLAQARSGKPVVLVSPNEWSPELARLQEGLGLRWGLWRAPGSAAWGLVVGGGDEDAPDGLLLRTTCIGFAPSDAHALARPIGKSLIATVERPGAEHPSGSWCELEGCLRQLPEWSVKLARDRQADLLADATSTVGPFEVNESLMEGTASLQVSRALTGRRLSFHFRRLSHSLISHDWTVPRVSLLVNGHELPHNYNPCRPESPPQEWDSLYFGIPQGLLRFDGTDRVTIRSASPATDRAALRSDLREGLELTIEDAAVAGETTLVALPQVALAPPPRLDALLGLDGGIRFRARDGGADLTLVGGKPYNGWPATANGVSHCVFDEEGLDVLVHVPRGSAGKLEAFAFDYEAYRRESIAFEDEEPIAVEGFGAGKWLTFPFGAGQTADGELRLAVRNVEGANCVLSRVRVEFGP